MEKLNTYLCLILWKKSQNSSKRRQKTIGLKRITIDVSTKMMLGTFMGLKADESPGTDDLHNKDLKEGV